MTEFESQLIKVLNEISEDLHTIAKHMPNIESAIDEIAGNSNDSNFLSE